MLIFTTKKPRLLRHFKKDPVLFAYHIGDLDDFYFPDCQWAGDYDGSHVLREVALIYTGCQSPTLLAFGLTDVMHDLIDSLMDLLPRRFYGHFFKQYRDQLQRSYRETTRGTFHKMKLEAFNHVDTDQRIRRLDRRDENTLRDFYPRAYPDNFFVPRMLDTNKYFGLFENDTLAAVSGVHVASDEYNIAVLGNIATLPEYRGKGYGTRVTSNLVRELHEEGKTICLNVKADNDHAIRSYRRLGFVKTHEYEEALFDLKS